MENVLVLNTGPVSGNKSTAKAKSEPNPNTAQQIAQQIERLTSLESDELRRVWVETYGKPPPAKTNREILLLGIAYRIQEKAFGGLSAATKRRLIRLTGGMGGEGEDAAATAAQDSRARLQAIRVRPGTRLLREWKGETHQVIALDEGFSWRGKTFASLSEVARAITGTRWNGWAFFGLRKATSLNREKPEARP